MIVALMTCKGYALSEIKDVELSIAEYKNEKGEKLSGAYAWTEKDAWENSENKEKKEWKIVKCEGKGNFKGLNDFMSLPAWFNKLLNEYIKNEEGGKVFKNIPLHSCENAIIATIKKLKNEGKIKNEYSLKNLRGFAVKKEFEKSKDLKKLQKMLNHSNLNTTKRFLQNMGIKL